MRGTRRVVGYLAIATTQLMVILDGTVVTVALPALREALGFSDAALPWVANAFFVAFALALLPAGRLGDLVGARAVFLTGLAVFTAASLWCGLAQGPGSLLAARALQGLGGGGATAVALGMVARLYPEPALRRRAFAGLAFVGSAGASIGLVAGGLLVEVLSWSWVFWVNLPFGVVAFVMARRALEPVAGERRPGGLVPRVLLTDGRFLLATGVLLTMVMAGASFQFLTSIYLQDTLGYGPLATGSGFLATSGAIAVGSLGLSGWIAGRWGAARALRAALVVFGAGMLLMVRLPDDGSYLLDVFAPLVVMGLGFGVAMPQVIELAMSVVPVAHTGAGSGLVSTVQQAGAALGLFVVVGVATATTRGLGYLIAALGLGVGALLAGRLAGAGDGPGEGPDVTGGPSATRAGAGGRERPA